MTKIKIGAVSLGCDKNRVDTEIMLQKLSSNGYEIISEPDKADVIIINTCAFLEAARKESIETVLDLSTLKNDESNKKIVVTGCLPELYGKEIYENLTEADCVCGTNFDIVDAVKQTLNGERIHMPPTPRKKTVEPRLITTPIHYAYLKIADGCDNFCSYCLIPKIRGNFFSYPLEQLVAQAESLTAKGVSEIILVAQDVTKYGFDLYGKPQLVELLRKLGNIKNLKRIRLLYCYPELVTDELLDEIQNNEKICKYIDIPLQHVDGEILKRMNRKSNEISVLKLFEKLTQNYPEIKVRSTFICGFPGETKQQHNKIKAFLSKYKLYNVGFFAYSQEDGTSAAKMPEQINEKAKQKRVKELYLTQSKIVSRLNKSFKGRIVECVIDEDAGDFYIGRTEFQSPEIDGITKIYSKKPLLTGEYVSVKIVGYDKYDLIGEIK